MTGEWGEVIIEYIYGKKYKELINASKATDEDLNDLATATSTDERKIKLGKVFQDFSVAARKLYPFDGVIGNTEYEKWIQAPDPFEEVEKNIRRRADGSRDRVSMREFLKEYPTAGLKILKLFGRDTSTFRVFQSESPKSVEAAFSPLRPGRFYESGEKETLEEAYQNKLSEQPVETESFLTEEGRQAVLIEYAQKHVGERPILGR